MKLIQNITITLFILASLLVGRLSYGQILYKGLGITTNDLITGMRYTSPAGFSVFEIKSPAAAKGFFVVNSYDGKIVLFDGPLQISDSLKATKALLETVKKLFEYYTCQDSLIGYDIHEALLKRYIDSFQVNSSAALEAALNKDENKTSYYKGRCDVFYELSLYEEAKYLNKKP